MRTRREVSLGGTASLLAPADLLAQSTSVRPTILVIGNGAFAGYPELPNPVRDARLVTNTLVHLGYNCTLITHASLERFRSAFKGYREYLARNAPARAAVFVASHGVQIGGESVLLPSDAENWRTPRDALRRGIRVSELLNGLRDSGAISFAVFLDACRSNPFATTTGTEVGLKALAASAYADVPEGVALSLSTQPGGVALDGPIGGNSLYATAFARILRSNPRATIGSVLSGVRTYVNEASGGQQTPWSDITMAPDTLLIAEALRG